MKRSLLAVVILLAAFAAQAMPAPGFTLHTLDGRAVRLAGYRGKVVLVNFWATWCAGCRVEMPQFVGQYRRNHAKGLEIIGISMDDEGAAIAPFLKEQHVNYTIVKGDAAVAKAYGGVRYLPQTVVIDRRGELVKTFDGPPDEKELDALLERLLASTAGRR
jgi:cytochrome c biogenesis protein CcmG/thiol:disulfide interchange protein DsbE